MGTLPVRNRAGTPVWHASQLLVLGFLVLVLVHFRLFLSLAFLSLSFFLCGLADAAFMSLTRFAHGVGERALVVGLLPWLSVSWPSCLIAVWQLDLLSLGISGWLSPAFSFLASSRTSCSASSFVRKEVSYLIRFIQ